MTRPLRAERARGGDAVGRVRAHPRRRLARVGSSEASASSSGTVGWGHRPRRRPLHADRHGERRRARRQLEAVGPARLRSPVRPRALAPLKGAVATVDTSPEMSTTDDITGLEGPELGVRAAAQARPGPRRGRRTSHLAAEGVRGRRHVARRPAGRRRTGPARTRGRRRAGGSQRPPRARAGGPRRRAPVRRSGQGARPPRLRGSAARGPGLSAPHRRGLRRTGEVGAHAPPSWR